jgi:hypothetical protein
MNGASFELNVSVSDDVRLAGTIRVLAVCAANLAGCPDAAAAAFGRDVENQVRAFLEGGLGRALPVTVRQRESRVEVVINGRTLTLDV